MVETPGMPIKYPLTACSVDCTSAMVAVDELDDVDAVDAVVVDGDEFVEFASIAV
jgi:hypothetical protein